MTLPLLKFPTVANVTIGQWLLALWALALVSWGQAAHHNLSQFGMLGAGLLVYWAARRLSTTQRQWIIFGAAWLTIATLFILTGIYGWERLPAEPVNPNALAAVILLALPSIPMFAALAGLFIAGSRAAYVAAFVYAAHGLIARWDEVQPVWSALIRWLLVAVATLVIAFGLVFIRPETVFARIDTWGAAVKVFERAPVWGVGYGNYVYYARGADRGKLHADSLPLTLLAEMGWVGGGAALAIIGAIAWRVARSAARPQIKWGLALWLGTQAVDHTAGIWFVLAVLMLVLSEAEL